MTNDEYSLGANARRAAVLVVVAAVVAVAVALLGAGVVGQATRPASAQAAGGGNPLSIYKAVYPSPQSAIPVGTNMDFLITVSNNSPYPFPGVTVTDVLPGGVTFVAANASQGRCNPMADRPAVYCELDSIPPGNVAHVDVIVTATRPGTYTNVAQDQLGDQAAATYTVIPRLLR